METQVPQPEKEQQLFFTKNMKLDLKASSNWSSFISIFTISILTLTVFGYTYLLYIIYSYSPVPMNEILSEMPWQGYTFLGTFIGFLILLVITSLSLLLFSFEVKKAINYDNSDAMDLALDLLFKFFRYNGIIIIASVVLVFLFFLYIENASRL